MTTPPTPVHAATIILLRQAASGMQVFLQQRNPKAKFGGGAYVFPGGKIDPQDRVFPRTFLDLSKEQEDVFEKNGGLVAVIAALRECFEESGVLLANDANGFELAIDNQAGPSFETSRKQLVEQKTTFAKVCAAQELRLALNEIFYINRWITPKSSPIRFDTRFYLAVMPAKQKGYHDGYEAVDSIWLTPQQALNKYSSDELHLMTPTLKSLEFLAQYETISAVLKAGAD